jgi:urease accessory protein
VSDPGTVLALLQNADSFFPSGSVAFSWGLEGLHADGCVNRQAIQPYLDGQLRGRWNPFDRPAVCAAHAAADDLGAVALLDGVVETLSWPSEAREGSRRLGAAMLNIHERLGTPGAAAYRTKVREGRAYGHLPIMQGLLWRGCGLDQALTVMASAHAFCVSLLGAALRLGLVGHVDAQRALAAARITLSELLAQPPRPAAEMGAFVPASDIAMMRHETQTTRLFSN